MPNWNKMQSKYLIHSKMIPPSCGRALVPRSRLDSWLNSTETVRVVIVNAPAGFGKTTLLVQWCNQLQRLGEVTVWLTLDESDNDPGRFLANLVAAIRKSIPGVENMPINADFVSGGEIPSGVMLWLLDILDSFQSDLYIFFDDIGGIHNLEVLAIVQQLIHNLPPGKRLVMSQRHALKLGLSKLRARGELVEINVDDLRFTFDETSQFFRQSQLFEMCESDLQYLQQSTEGWIIGLQLSTISSAWRKNSGDFIQSCSVDFRHISSYLAEDVLARQPEEIQVFLMQTSILNRLTGPICDVLTGRGDGFETLDYLERSNLFIIPLDEEKRWYRYHSLFSKFLLNRLERKIGHEHLNQLHRLASQWYEKEGEFQEAAQHALASNNIEFAAELMERCAMMLLLIGQMVTVVEWGDKMSPEVLDHHPSLCLAYCFALAFRQEYEKSSKVLGRYDLESFEFNDKLTFKEELLSVRALLSVSQDNIIECTQSVFDSLAYYSKKKLEDHGRFVVNSLLLTLAGYIKIIEGDFDEALAYLGQASSVIRRMEASQVGTIYNKYFIACLELTQGRLCNAIEIVSAVLSDKSIGPARYSTGGMAAAVLQAEVHYEMNQLEIAEKLIMPFRNMLRTSVPPDAMITGLRTLARIYFVRGNENGAMHCLDELERLGAELSVPRASDSARFEKIRIALCLGDLERALQISRDIDNSVWQTIGGRCMIGNDLETPEICRIRLMIASGKAKEALEKLKIIFKTAQSSRRIRRLILISILMAKAYAVCGERRASLRALSEALLAAQTGPFVRSFLDEGEPVATLLKEIFKTYPVVDSVFSANISSDYLKLFFPSLGIMPMHQAAQQSNQSSLPFEELTDRERAILEKLAMGLSNEAIGDQLFVSKSTVRFHLRNIHSKLGTSNRTQTVTIARQLGLVK